MSDNKHDEIEYEKHEEIKYEKYEVVKEDLKILHEVFSNIFLCGYESAIIDEMINSYIYVDVNTEENIKNKMRGAWNFPTFTSFMSEHTLRFGRNFGRQTLRDKKTGDIFLICFYDMSGKYTGPFIQYHLTNSSFSEDENNNSFKVSPVLHIQGIKVNGLYDGPYKEWTKEGKLCVDGIMKDDEPYVPYIKYWNDKGKSGIIIRRTIIGDRVLIEEFERGENKPWSTFTVPIDDVYVVNAFSTFNTD